MAPLILEIKKFTEIFDVKVCITAQHRQMLDQVLHFFDITPDYDLNLMKNNQDLATLTSLVLTETSTIIEKCVPDFIIVQGDTTTVFASSLAAFYKDIKVVHIEAGLRSGNHRSPFPEEMNRIFTAFFANYHFAPTIQAAKNLYSENIKNNVFVVGNTVIDALFLGLDIVRKNESKYFDFFKFIDLEKRIILITGHRRESFGQGFENICNAILEIANKFNDIQIVYPVHLNPNVMEPVGRILGSVKNVFLIEPLDYPSLIWLLNKSYFVMTDSGGIQEEAPALGKPVLVLRDVTERMEGIEAKTAKLVGTDTDAIIHEACLLLEDRNAYEAMSKAVNPYGDGTASRQIIDILKHDNI